MLLVVLACASLLALVTLTHYEALRLLSTALPRLRMPHRAKLLVVMAGAFLAHALEIALYGFAAWALVHWGGAGTLGGSASPGLAEALYFSAQNYTSLGYGDIVPGGPLRLMTAVEALHGLLMIGWTASFAYVAMERFWEERAG
jgi:hypothetical protein